MPLQRSSHSKMSTSSFTRRRTSSSGRVDALLQAMTLEEKLGQMAQIDINMLLVEETNDETNRKQKVLNMTLAKYWIGERKIGSVLNAPAGLPWTASDYRRVVLQLQEILQQEQESGSRSNEKPPIPVIWGLDSIHGANYVHGAIMTPQPLNLAATFNTTTAYQAGLVASRDTRAAGITWLFSPLLGIAVENKWSRVYETFGEDPLVVGHFAKSLIAGIQQPDATGVPSKAAACAKHFVGYSAPRNGHDRSPAWIPTRHLYQYFVPPWKRVLTSDDADSVAMTVMESYSEVDGLPNVGNYQTMQYLLRERLQYGGMVVTDYEEMRNLRNWHKITPDTSSAVVHSLRQTSIDMSMVPYALDEYLSAIQSAIQNHEISMDRIDDSVRRVLQLKVDLGMFDETLTLEDPNVNKVGTDRPLALDMAQQSLVVAENRMDTLPLIAGSNQRLKILVTGPTASSLSSQTGGWSGQWQGVPNDDDYDWWTYGTTVISAMTSDARLDVSYACGVDILGNDCDDDPQQDAGIVNEVKDFVGLGPHSSIERSVKASQNVDVVVVCVGEESYTEKPGDIRSLALPEGQYELVRSFAKKDEAGPKVILVYFGGRPRLLKDMVDHSDAVILAFLPGPDAGQAVVDVIMGDVNPSGRLPITYPKEEDGAGGPYYHSVSDQCTEGDGTLPHYNYVPCRVMWPFGHGLSYTEFSYSNLSASGGIDRDLTFSVAVTNTGTRAGAEAVLAFTFDEFRLTTPEYKRLRFFDKVYLEPGESRTIESTIPLEDLMFVGPHDDRHYIIDPNMVVWVGVGASTDCRRDPESNDLCVRLESDTPDTSYIGACEAACDLWSDSGCLDNAFGVGGRRSCIEKCRAISKYPSVSMNMNNEGWGWNYVNCLEGIVLGSSSSHKSTDFCWKMTSMCRDVFTTGLLDEHGLGPGTMSPNSLSASNFVALFTALIAATVMAFLMNGGSLWKRHDKREVEFTRVQSEEDEPYEINR